MCTFVYTFIITRMTQLSTSTMHQWIIILRKQIISLEKFHFNLHLSCKNIHHVEERKEEEKTGLKHLEPQYCFFYDNSSKYGVCFILVHSLWDHMFWRSETERCVRLKNLHFRAFSFFLAFPCFNVQKQRL